VLAILTSAAKLPFAILKWLKNELPFQISNRTAVMRIVSTTASRRALNTPELSGLDLPLDMRDR
jgi:hypothetical protein